MIVYLAALLVVALPALSLVSVLGRGRQLEGAATTPPPDWRQAADRHVVVYYDPAAA